MSRSIDEARAGAPACGAVVALLMAIWAGNAHADDVFSEVRLGALAHDVAFAGGIEHGADINAEIMFTSPFSPEFGMSWPQWLRWIAHPRPHVGVDANTAGATSQVYLGMTWTTVLATSLVSSQDRLELNYLFGPAFNNGYDKTDRDDRKSLGSHVLFHLGGEIAYWVTPVTSVGVYFDHSSNGGLARPNDSLNNLGLRVGYRF